MSLDPDRDLQDEVTRVESVAYLQGTTGHGVLALVLLAVGGVGYWATRWLVLPVGAISASFLVSANGLSIYLWDAITTYVWAQEADAEGAAEPTEQRTLSVSLSPSTAHKSEFAASVFQVALLVTTLGVIVNAYRALGPETASVLLAALLAAGNAGALVLEALGLT